MDAIRLGRRPFTRNPISLDGIYRWFGYIGSPRGVGTKANALMSILGPQDNNCRRIMRPRVHVDLLPWIDLE